MGEVLSQCAFGIGSEMKGRDFHRGPRIVGVDRHSGGFKLCIRQGLIG